MIHVGDRSVYAAAYPIGVDYKEFGEAVESATAREAFERLRKSAAGRRTIIGVDRLDYSKGLEERLLGYCRFQEKHGASREHQFHLKIVPPSRGEGATYEVNREHL